MHAASATFVLARLALKPKRIGIYSGTFDPVHAGHIAFALQALRVAKLDRLYFMPERQPRHKQHIAHFAHRVAMLRRAIRPHQNLAVLEMEDKEFSVARTLPRLRKRFGNATLVYVCGSDIVKHMATWPHVPQLLANGELCIGLRDGETQRVVRALVDQLPARPAGVIIIDSYSAEVSSSAIRQAIREHRTVRGLLHSVRSYAAQEWLYL